MPTHRETKGELTLGVRGSATGEPDPPAPQYSARARPGSRDHSERPEPSCRRLSLRAHTDTQRVQRFTRAHQNLPQLRPACSCSRRRRFEAGEKVALRCAIGFRTRFPRPRTAPPLPRMYRSSTANKSVSTKCIHVGTRRRLGRSAGTGHLAPVLRAHLRRQTAPRAAWQREAPCCLLTRVRKSRVLASNSLRQKSALERRIGFQL